jgi:hypothetical protein
MWSALALSPQVKLGKGRRAPVRAGLSRWLVIYTHYSTHH